MSDNCRHIWESTDTDVEGNPSFRVNRMMWSGERAHVICTKCNARTWMTREEWDDLLEDTP